MNCTEPPAVENAMVIVESYLYEGTANYTCDSGFEVTNVSSSWSITCQSDATWTSGETCSSKG